MLNIRQWSLSHGLKLFVRLIVCFVSPILFFIESFCWLLKNIHKCLNYLRPSCFPNRFYLQRHKSVPSPLIGWYYGAFEDVPTWVDSNYLFTLLKHRISQYTKFIQTQKLITWFSACLITIFIQLCIIIIWCGYAWTACCTTEIRTTMVLQAYYLCVLIIERWSND